MENEAERKSHAGAWTLAVVALLVVYVGSAGVIDTLYTTGRLPGSPPPWLERFYSPIIWAAKNTPLHKPMEVYVEWLAAMFRKW